MIKIVCTSCQKPLSLDETKLPMKEVSFPCPVCKVKLTVDRRNLEMANAAAAPAAEVHPAEAHDDEEAFGAKALIGPQSGVHSDLPAGARVIGTPQRLDHASARLQAQRPQVRLSRAGERSRVLEAVRLGVHEFLLKPVSSATLVARSASLNDRSSSNSARAGSWLR